MLESLDMLLHHLICLENVSELQEYRIFLKVDSKLVPIAEFWYRTIGNPERVYTVYKFGDGQWSKIKKN